MRMATVFRPRVVKTVRVLQSNCHLQRTPVSGPRRETKDFGMEAAPDKAPFLLSRSCYTRRSPVVVLLDGTVGAVMVPKQT